MRDLKHLIYFENLLQQANNDLVQAACRDGRLALAWNCSYIPEVLLDTDKCFGVRLRAPNCTNPDMATYYMTNRSCPYSKSILERAFEGGYNFISALIGILQHWRILPIFIRLIGTLLSKVNGMGKLESFNAVSSLILGQSENFIAYKGVLGDLSSRRLFTMSATAMSTVSLSIVGAYMSMLDAKYVVAALILNMFSTFIVLSIINPTRPGSEEEIKLEKLHESQSFFEMLGEYILAGFKVAMIILAMLIGFIALISAINALFATLFGLSFQQILGYVFYPLAWLIGIPLSDALSAGSIMATKLVANEFVAMIELQKIAASMTPRGLGILSVFLVSFANFASIGIIAGAIKGLNEQQGNIVSRFGLRLVYGATLVSLLSASFAGLVL